MISSSSSISIVYVLTWHGGRFGVRSGKPSVTGLVYTRTQAPNGEDTRSIGHRNVDIYDN